MMKKGRVRIGWFSSVRSAIAGAVFGALLFFGALALLWVNEGRTNLASLARRALVASPERADPALDGALVSVTHTTAADALVSDQDFLLPGPWLALERRAEMYSWIELCERDRCRYERRWTSCPPPSGRFRDPSGHHNPALRVHGARFVVDGSIGAYRFRGWQATLPAPRPLALSQRMIRPDPPHGAALHGDYLYIGAHGPEQPSVGDVRLSYRAVESGSLGTFFARQRGAQLEPYTAEATLCRLLRGDRDAAIRALAEEHFALGWLLRVLGFALLWLSMNLALGPLCAMFDVFPPLGRASRSLVALVTAPMAAGLAVTVVVISSLAHNVWLLALVLVAIALVVWALRKRPQ